MTVNVLLFGPQAQLADARQLAVDVAGESVTARAVLEALGEASAELRDSLRTSRLAVNHEFADAETTIKPGDEVALIGMVSGG